MELQQILERYAEAIEAIDADPPAPGANRRTGVIYHPGFKSMSEKQAIEAVDQVWEHLHPGERSHHLCEQRYPTLPRSAKLDHLLSSSDHDDETEPEWGIEIKRLQSFGDNGKVNDFLTAKVLSPYLRDRSLLHDALRLREHSFTKRSAVVGYGFNYDAATVEEALERFKGDESALGAVRSIRKTIEASGPMRLDPLIEFADSILRLRGFTRGPRAQAAFRATSHPAGGQGILFGWEIRVPRREPDYDPRHPW
ncbi:MAG: hypothetical protein SO046_09930 [Actinomyces urogenitalis]|uniref:hypothetical protein n=1 Tax=Actinomyces urogenitalis TaxID=103621 RepID=UPI002A83909B|nr:hypothetical protein [Actinomyces urogenitalis]MDY3679515.1 hypothetical protein [Actinomyces urogenitalis]